MRVLFALVALATIATALESFTIPLPNGPSQDQFYNGGAGDMYYTVGTGGALYGVNLTSKKIQFTSSYPSSGGEIQGLVPLDIPGGLVLVSIGDTLALNGHGDLLWASADFQLPTSENKHRYAVNGSKLFIVSEEEETFSVINLETGNTIKSFDNIQSGEVFSDRALLTKYDYNTGNDDLICYSIPSLTIMWRINNCGTFIASSSKYLLVENVTNDGDHEVVVMDLATKKVINVIQAMNGILSNQIAPTLKGDILIAELGEDEQRLCAFNVTSGIELWQRFIPYGDGSVVLVGYDLVSISQCTLSIFDIMAGTTITHNDVPYTPDHTVFAAGGSMFNVKNLCGYTTWNTAGDYIGRNEKAPNAGGGGGGGNNNGVVVYDWKDEYDVTTVGSSVVGTPIHS